jgi:hypothetical protein
MIDEIADGKEDEDHKRMRDPSHPWIPAVEFVNGKTGQRDPERGEKQKEHAATDVAIHSKAAQKAFKKSKRVAHQPNGMESQLWVSEHSVKQ